MSLRFFYEEKLLTKWPMDRLWWKAHFWWKHGAKAYNAPLKIVLRSAVVDY